MSSFLAKFMAFWPLAVFALPVLLGIGLLWLRTKFPDLTAFNGAVARVGALESQVEILEVKLAAAKQHMESEPTRAQMVDKIDNAIARLSRMEGKFESIDRHMKSQSEWIQALALPEGRR